MKNKKLNENEVKKINGGIFPGSSTGTVETASDIAKRLCSQGLIKHGKVIESDDSKLAIGTECGGIIRRKVQWTSATIFECSKCKGWHYSFFSNELEVLEEFDLEPSSRALIKKEKDNK